MFLLIALLTAWTFGVVSVMSLCLAAKLGDTPEPQAPAVESFALSGLRELELSLN